MAPPKTGKKAAEKKKEKVFHPQSRKAGRLIRTQHRKSKLAEQAKARSEKHDQTIDIFSFFYSVLPTEGAVLSLEDMHSIINHIWLTRFDGELEEEREARRKGRPKSVKEQKLEEIKLRESEGYRTGMEVIDLMDTTNVELFRRWDQKEAAYIRQLRFVRLSSTAPCRVVVSRPGKHPSLIPDTVVLEDQQMDVDEVPLLMEPPSRFASAITTMNAPF